LKSVNVEKGLLRILRLARRARGIEQSELAEIAGISQPHLSQIESRRVSLSRERFFLMIKALGLSPEFIDDPSVTPFGSGSFFLMFFQENGKGIAYYGFLEHLAELVEFMGDVDILFLVMGTNRERLVRAFLIRDQFDNLFLFRRKRQGDYLTFELDLRAQLGKMIRGKGLAVRFGSVRIFDDISRKIDKSIIGRKDVEDFFDVLCRRPLDNPGVYNCSEDTILGLKETMKALGLDFRDISDLV